jgi:hypothetical protein
MMTAMAMVQKNRAVLCLLWAPALNAVVRLNMKVDALCVKIAGLQNASD